MPSLTPSSAELGEPKDDNGSKRDLLSPELREKFDILTSIVRSRQVTEDQTSAISPVEKEIIKGNINLQQEENISAPEEPCHNFDASQQSLPPNGLPYDLALAAAIAAEQQISNLRNGIAELEALLAITCDRTELTPVVAPNVAHQQAAVVVPMVEQLEVELSRNSPTSHQNLPAFDD